MRLKLTVLFLISLLAFQSCDYLDKTPDEDLTIDDVFTREEWIRGFLSNIYTNGLGPEVHFKMQLTATARVTFSHEFKSAGINQVLHIISVDMDIRGSLIVAGYKDGVSVATSAMAAQTVIVGITPEAFTQVIESENDNTAGLINDYGAVAGE